jgi:hypothetical protein
MNPTVSGPPNIPAGRRSSHSPRHAPGARPVPCPYCGATSGVRQTSDTGRIQAWACDRCATDFAFTVPDSRTAAALLGDLGAVAQEIRPAALDAGPGDYAGRRDAEANRRGVAYPVADANQVGCPVTRPARWATSPLDADVHLRDGQRSRSATAQRPCGPSISTGGSVSRSASAWI